MENNIETIKEKINNIDTLNDTVLSTLVNQIHSIQDESVRYELYNLFMEKVKDYLKNNLNKLTEDDIKNIIATATIKLRSSVKFDEQLLIDNNFYEESIFNELNKTPTNTQNITEISIIETKINSLGINIENKDMPLDIESLLIEEAKKKFINYSDEELLNLLSNNESSLKNVEEEIRNEIKSTLNGRYNSINPSEMEQLRDKITKKVTEYNQRIISENDKIIFEIEQRKREQFRNYSDEELLSLLSTNKSSLKNVEEEIRNEIKASLNDRYSSISQSEMEQLRDEITKKIIEHNEQILQQNDKITYEIEQRKRNQFINYSDEELLNLISNNESSLKNIEEEIRNEIKASINDRYSSISQSEMEQLRDEITKKVTEHNEEILKQNEQIKEELELRKIRPLTKIKDYKEFLIPEEIDKITKFVNLNLVKNAYYKIMDDTIKHFENLGDNEKTIENIIRYVTEHDLFNVLSKYENHKKLEKELVEDILNKLNIINVENVENVENVNENTKTKENKKLWLKALAAVSGFAAGLGVSCVPGIGTITMGISVTKLVANTAKSTINFFAKRNPEGKCAKIKNFSEKQFNKLTGKLEDKYPGITEKIKNMKAKLKESPLNCFINGLAAGYITGNLIEMFTGETLLDNAKNLFDNNSNSIPQISPEGITSESIIESNNSDLLAPPVTNVDPSGISGIDLSSVSQGFTSSYSDKPVNLFTELAKNLSFDKVNIVNGEEWWHFIQPDGSGYAWFKADDVRHLVEAATKTAGKTM